MNAEKGTIIDHINCDRLDNRKSNLRIVSTSQNAQNSIKKTDEYVGISFDKLSNNWRCRIRINGTQKSISFKNKEHAAYWYDTLALEHYGLNARINNIKKPDDFIEPIKRELPKGIYTVKDKYYVQYKRKHVGTFNTLNEAINAYKEKEDQKQEKHEDQKDQGVEIIRNKNGIAIIITSKKEEILVDDDKYSELSKYTWYINNNGYAITTISDKLVSMHRYLLNAKEKEIIDFHVNLIKTF